MTDNFSETIQNVKNNIESFTDKATDTVATEAKNTLDKLGGLADSSGQTLSNLTNVSVHKINDATTSISEAADKTKLFLDATLQKTEQLSSAIANSLQEVIVTSVQMWMVEHPAIAWIVNHPLLAIILILFIFLVLWNLLNAIIKLVPQIFLFVLKIPFISAFKVFQNTRVIQSNNLDIQERLPNILIRLEELRKEQDNLMREMKEILTSGKY